MQDVMDATLDGVDHSPALPLPEVVDTPAVVLAAMLGGGTRPLVLDASAVREVQANAAPLLLALLRAKRDVGVEARIIGAGPALCRRLDGHPLAAFIDDEGLGAEALFICPDRDELGFSPSLR